MGTEWKIQVQGSVYKLGSPPNWTLRKNLRSNWAGLHNCWASLRSDANTSLLSNISDCPQYAYVTRRWRRCVRDIPVSLLDGIRHIEGSTNALEGLNLKLEPGKLEGSWGRAGRQGLQDSTRFSKVSMPSPHSLSREGQYAWGETKSPLYSFSTKYHFLLCGLRHI